MNHTGFLVGGGESKGSHHSTPREEKHFDKQIKKRKTVSVSNSLICYKILIVPVEKKN